MTETLEVLRRARRAGYRRGQTAVYELMRELCPQVRFGGVASDFTQRGFG